MHREKRRNKIIILILVGIICVMGAGYAAFQTQITVTGVGNVSGEWSVRITNVEVTEEHNGGTNKTFSFEDTTAELEADLYNKGDYVLYTITVANEGDFDAKLETLNLEQSTNDAVLITSAGLTKGQSLLKGESTQFTVKIEYNSNYAGDATGTSGMADLTLNFVQNSGGTIIPSEDYLVTYDYTTNGGTSTNAENAYLAEGEAVNLNYAASKENAEFLGWNTNSQAGEGLQSLSMPANNITLYAIFKDIDTTPPTITNVSTTSTINSITVVTTAIEEDGQIDTYEYSIDNGNNWVKISGSNSYTFNNLTSNTEYSILIRVRNTGNTYSEQTVTVSTKELNAPTFSEVETDNGKTVTITYPEGNGLTYEYKKDNGSWVTAIQGQQVEFTESGTLVARVSDGESIVNSAYTVAIYLTGANAILDMVENDTGGKGLYADDYVENVYIYKGSDPDNYVNFNNETWRIASVNANDNTIKIIKVDNSLGHISYDRGRYNSSGYCNYDGYGCNIWGSSNTLYDVNMSPITTLPRTYNGSVRYDLPTDIADLNEYLNVTYYNGLSSAAKNMIIEATYNAGVLGSSNSNMETDISQVSSVKWRGKVALLDAAEYARISGASSVESIASSSNDVSSRSSWLNPSYSSCPWWTMSPYSSSTRFVWVVVGYGYLTYDTTYDITVNNRGYVRPVVTLSPEVQIIGGVGTEEYPFRLNL